MKVLVLSNGNLETKEIPNGLETLQEIVGGYIEIPYLGDTFRDNEIDVIINEEGKLIEGMKPEIVILDGETEELLDIVYGNCIFASHDEEGNTTELTAEQLEIVEQELGLSAKVNLKKAGVFDVRVLIV